MWPMSVGARLDQLIGPTAPKADVLPKWPLGSRQNRAAVRAVEPPNSTTPTTPNDVPGGGVAARCSRRRRHDAGRRDALRGGGGGGGGGAGPKSAPRPADVCARHRHGRHWSARWRRCRLTLLSARQRRLISLAPPGRLRRAPRLERSLAGRCLDDVDGGQ